MKYIDEESFLSYIKAREIVIWGAGAWGGKIAGYLADKGIKSFKFIDSNAGGNQYGWEVLSVEYIKKYRENLFVFIACSARWFEEEYCLLEYGYKKYDEFINGTCLNNELLVCKYYMEGKEFAHHLSDKELDLIERNVKDAGIDFEIVSVDLGHAEELEFEQKFDFARYYSKGSNITYQRKVWEYWFAFKLLGLEHYKKDDVYVDIGSCTSMWVFYLRRLFSLNAFGIDICEGPVKEDYYIVADAKALPFSDNSVEGISMQSTFCLLEDDLEVLHECWRVLKKNGKIIISPLYLYPENVCAASAEYYAKGYCDKDSKEIIRADCSGIKKARYYDVETLKSKILDACKQFGLTYKIYCIPTSSIPPFDIAYMKFILEFTKV